MDYCNHVLWSDETNINLFGSDGVKHVWWQPGEEYKDKCVLPTDKHGGGSVMVWDCMSAAGIGELQFIEGIMNANLYCDILKQIMIPSLWRLGRRAVFQHDNDHCLAKEAEGKGDGLTKYVSRPKPYWASVGHPQTEGGKAQGLLTSSSSLMSSWRHGRGLQWQPVKLWWTPCPRGLRQCWKWWPHKILKFWAQFGHFHFWNSLLWPAVYTLMAVCWVTLLYKLHTHYFTL